MNRAPNHPMLASGLFEALASSVSDAPSGNMYGNLLTPSYVQCGGLNGNENDDVEFNLQTNTALTNGLQASSVNFLTGRLISPNDGTPPTFTYSSATAVCIGNAETLPLQLTNKTVIIGLGHVVSREEVTSTERDSAIRLEVTVAHNDWDSERKIHRRFLAKYVVPGTKNLIKTHQLYQVGREVQIVGVLVNFDEDSHMPIVLVSSVSVTSGPLSANAKASGSTPPGNRPGRNFRKFSPTKTSQGSTLFQAPTGPSTFSNAAAKAHAGEHKGKGKAKDKVVLDDTTDQDGSPSEEEFSIPSPQAAAPKRPIGRPRKVDIAKAAKQMRRN